MERVIRYLIPILAVVALTVRDGNALDDAANNHRLDWFRDAKFGLFIHWGLYAIPAGEWNGEIYPGASEWLMYRAEIPVREYEKLAPRFNPVKFDADAWVRMAHEAGMKYLVITSKHHDGFAMFHSKASAYNIVDATPFKRDPMKELAAACKKYGLKFCFYYSQTQDWHEPNGIGNDWDFGPDSAKNFTQYYETKVKPQVREILTQYGPLGLIWFDTPRNMTPAQSKELAELVHQLQPDCLVDGRIGNNMGDYKTKGDNRLPSGSLETDWETPATMNTSWGFKRSDENWKSVRQLIRAVVEVSAKGGNYLLNVGPTSEGLIPQPSIERLKHVGEWMKVYSTSVYGTRMSPWTIPPEWGMITWRPGALYLHVFHWPSGGTLELHGLQSKVVNAALMGTNTKLDFHQSSTAPLNVSITIPATPPDSNDAVIALQIEGDPVVSRDIYQEQNGAVSLYGIVAGLHNEEQPAIYQDDTGVRGWTNPQNWMEWKFVVTKPGTFKVSLGSYAVTSGSGRTRKTQYEGGHDLAITMDGQQLSFHADTSEAYIERPTPYFADIVSDAGDLTISSAGSYTLQLRASHLDTALGNGCVVRWVRLKPVPNR